MTSVLVTRPAGGDDPLARRLADLGYRVHAVPTVALQTARFEPPAGMDDYDGQAYRW